MARQARPWFELTKFLMKNSVNSMMKKTQANVVWCGMPLKPAAPPTYWMFMMTMRMISPRPSVAMAR